MGVDMSILGAKPTVIEFGNGESITVRQLTIDEYHSELFRLCGEYGNEDTINNFCARIITAIEADILVKLTFAHIISWELKDANGNDLDLTYHNFGKLPFWVKDKIDEAIEDK
jgi:hypothetical protein